ncbi:MAG: DUF2284 domain-containing protein [Promethearchaeota archaeon]
MPFLEIKLTDIIFDPKVQTYCVSSNFKCPSYGHSWACPPEAPYLEEFVSEFKKFYLIYYEFDFIDYIKKEKEKNPEFSEIKIRDMLFTNNFLSNKLEKEIFLFLDNYQENYEEKLILWDGYCRICHNSIENGCTYDSGKPCRYPDKKRYSMEAVGIDVTAVSKNLNIPIEWPPTNNIYRFGLLCFK